MVRLRAFVAEFDAATLLAGSMPAAVLAWTCFCDWKLMPRLQRMLAFGYNAVYLLIPLAFVAAWGASRNRRAHGAVALLVSLLVAGPFWYAKTALPKNWALDDPARALAPLAVAAVLTMGSWWSSDAKAEDYGIGLGDWRWWGPKIGIALAIIVPAAFLVVAFVPGMKEYYPQEPRARADLVELLITQLGRGACLFGEEFLWHGLGLFAVAKTHGKRAAILYTSLAYYLLHRGKPDLEMLSSFVGAALLAVVSLRCRTFLPAFLGHWPLNFCVELAAFLIMGPRTDTLHIVR